MLVDFSKNLTIPSLYIQIVSGAHKASLQWYYGLFPNSKAARPLISIQCQGLECSELYFYSSIQLQGVQCDNFTLSYIKILKVQYYFLYELYKYLPCCA